MRRRARHDCQLMKIANIQQQIQTLITAPRVAAISWWHAAKANRRGEHGVMRRRRGEPDETFNRKR